MKPAESIHPTMASLCRAAPLPRHVRLQLTPTMCSMSENGEVSILVVDGTDLVSEVSPARCHLLQATSWHRAHAIQIV